MKFCSANQIILQTWKWGSIFVYLGSITIDWIARWKEDKTRLSLYLKFNGYWNEKCCFLKNKRLSYINGYCSFAKCVHDFPSSLTRLLSSFASPSMTKKCIRYCDYMHFVNIYFLIRILCNTCMSLWFCSWLFIKIFTLCLFVCIVSRICYLVKLFV